MREMRVLGPPGTGKTSYLARQMGIAAVAHGADNVAVCSFTRAAAAEIAGRDTPIPPEAIGTLHSFGWRALGRPKVFTPKGWNAHVEANHLPAGWAISTGKVIDPDDPLADGSEGKDGDELLEACGRLRQREVSPERWPIHLQAFHRAWQNYKLADGLVDYSDMIELPLRRQYPMPGSPRVLFVDEAQDLTPLQLRLVLQWAESTETVVMALDDDQAIYEWAGADPGWFLEHPVEHQVVLSQSYRVPRAVHKFALAWVEQLSQREPKEYQPVGMDGAVSLVDTTWRRGDSLVDEIERELSTSDRSIMVLASCSHMLDPLKRELRERGVPFHNPYRRKRGDWNPLAATNGISTVQRILSFLRWDGDVWGDEAGFWTYDDVAAWIEMLVARDVLKPGAKKTTRNAWGDDPYDSDEFVGLFQEEHLESVYAGDLAWLERHMLADYRRRAEFPLRVLRTRGADVLRERPRVIIGTIHSVKGGEADVVYLFPDMSQAGQANWDGTQRERDSVIRLMYVGATRAKDELRICQPASLAAVPLEDFAA